MFPAKPFKEKKTFLFFFYHKFYLKSSDKHSFGIGIWDASTGDPRKSTFRPVMKQRFTFNLSTSIFNLMCPFLYSHVHFSCVKKYTKTQSLKKKYTATTVNWNKKVGSKNIF